ncbi:DUF5688 family protein [Butyrivibrio sp. XB500-5]|uniref:DUF5688 family protein n=1 Tax=Butyrivibrio sp. XB500-5 TaxID=2364880 RepID=UPI0018F75D00|nr:DUF5688 family protein [Butyrivibrio sp. XB500-5]
MNYEEFKDKVTEDVKRELESRTGKSYDVQTHSVEKMNENYDALTIKPEDGILGVNLNIGELYKAHEEGHSYEDLIDSAASRAESALENHPDFNLEALQDYDHMKETLSMEVVSAARNAELLDKVPHKEIEDMAVVYRFVVDTGDDGRGSILITNQLLDNYGITAQQLHEDALKYAPVMRPAVIKTMSETLMEMMGPEAKDMIPVMPSDPLFVASVPDKIQGASVIAYQDFMDQAAERVGGDFYILPSSIHEVLLVRDDGTIDRSNLEGMVKEVNETQVAPEDLLTDSVYHYDSKDKVFELAEKYEERMASKQRESVIDKLDGKKRETISHDSIPRPRARGGEAL